MEDTGPNVEGQGKPLPTFVSEETPRSDLRMIRAYARNPIKPEYREAIVNRTVRLALEAKEHVAIAAVRAFVALDKLNVDREKMDQKDEHREQDRTGPNSDTSGTLLTPDQDVGEMDATVPRPPPEPPANAEPTDTDAETEADDEPA